MKRNSSNGSNERFDFRLKRPAVALVAVGMILPEYLLVVAVSAFLAMVVLAIVETISHRDDPGYASSSEMTRAL